jgi:hypothetical protein
MHELRRGALLPMTILWKQRILMACPLDCQRTMQVNHLLSYVSYREDREKHKGGSLYFLKKIESKKPVGSLFKGSWGYKNPTPENDEQSAARSRFAKGC